MRGPLRPPPVPPLQKQYFNKEDEKLLRVRSAARAPVLASLSLLSPLSLIAPLPPPLLCVCRASWAS